MDLNTKIIEIVKNHDCMYNTQSPRNKDFEYKQHLWNEIGKKVGMSGEQAKKKWKNVRDSYKRYKQRIITEGGFRKQYKYAENLKFLDNYTIFRGVPTKSSVSLHDGGISSDLSSDLDLFEKKTDVNIKIIEIVKRYECLYNVQSPQYKDFEYKHNLWNEIGKEVGMSGETAKKKWKNARDCYKRCKQKAFTEGGFRRKYKYTENLKFLDDYTAFPSTRNTRYESVDEEVSTDLSSDTDLLCVPPVKKQKESFGKSAVTIQDFLEESAFESTENLNETKDPNIVTSKLFELLANKINKSNLTAQQKIEIEFAVSSVVYTKLAEFCKQNTAL